MAIIKCKMCGGDITIAADKTFGTCEYCGSTMTLPKVDDDQRAAAFNRGNHFRRIGEFDKALAVYERIVAEDNTDAEAHWCCALCRFGIEYVEDPATYEYLPTCHRASFDSILEDVDYLAAVEYSDGITRRQYQKDAAKIAEVQRGILATSSKEEPFDVFICYKESDAEGNRTRDSLLAQEVYYQLTEQGYRVFFSRITLEDKVGAQYEPYIFAALNSAKVMVAIGTKEEHFNAVWVKNEWSRFLALMKKDRSKLLLPCYRDMDPYDMPEALSVLQSYDMGKIGFIQDLVRGIGKVLHTEPVQKVKETVVVQSQQTSSTNTAALLKRAFMFLEDGEWDRADDFCEQVLNIDPECAEAYLVKLMIDLRVKTKDCLKDCAEPFDGNSNYVKALRFGDADLRNSLTEAIDYINIRNKNVHLEETYTRAKAAMDAAATEDAYKAAAKLFESISGYKDAAALSVACIEKAEVVHKDEILATAEAKMTGTKIVNYEAAVKLLELIPGWKDADEKKAKCERIIEELQEKQELARKKTKENTKKAKKIAAIFAVIAVIAIAAAIVVKTVVVPNKQYNDAVAMIDAGDVVEGYEVLLALDGYKDSAEKAATIFDKYKIEKVKTAEEGQYILFGAYEQDNNISNGKEDVEWLVLEVKDNKALVISKYVLACQQYHTEVGYITWEDSALRKWLNDAFINSVFTEEEKEMIYTSPVYWEMKNGTQDRVFLLSIAEAAGIPLDERKGQPTEYAIASGQLSGKECSWWLRSKGESGTKGMSTTADFMNGTGRMLNHFRLAINNNLGVRPAMWIDLGV